MDLEWCVNMTHLLWQSLTDLLFENRGSEVSQDRYFSPEKFFGQATKGIWWMPWRCLAMKDVVSCDKPRGVANKL